jgi:hypothetical protein
MVTPNISTRSWNWIRSGVVDSSHTPTDSAFDFCRFKRAPVARFYRWTASLIVLNAAGLLTKNITHEINRGTPVSSTQLYARQRVLQGAKERSDTECEQDHNQWTALSDYISDYYRSCEISVICTDAVACSYSACILSTNH